MTSLKILSVNARGLRDVKKCNNIFKYLKDMQYAIYCIQDFHCTESCEQMYEREWGYKAYFSSYTSNSRGVAILLNNTLNIDVHSVKKDNAGNWIMLDVETHGQRFTLVNLYGPNEDSPEFYKEVHDAIVGFENASILLCGDWNLVLNQIMDTKNYVRDNNVRARKEVQKMCEVLELNDPWRVLHQETRRYTWRQYRPVKMARLDFFWVTGDLLNLVSECNILPSYKSDHSAVVIVIKLFDMKRGKGSWKFNKSVLYEEEYVQLVKKCIKTNIERYVEEGDDVNSPNVKFTINDQLFF